MLREHALIESAVSSNRIEGVEVERRRVGTLVFGGPVLRDRSEEEVRGYRDALNLIHGKGRRLPVSDETVRRLHRLSRGRVWDAGRYKLKDADIIERYADGRERVRFRPVPARATPAAMRKLIDGWNACMRERWVHPLVAVAAFNLDLLCIHPFRDGNGRVSRLTLLLQCYHVSVQVGRYVSLERLIEQNKERYYETLEQCSRGWHEGKHDPWPYVNYLLFVLTQAYREFEQRVGQTAEPKGAKTEMVEAAIAHRRNEFTVSQLEAECPGVSRDMIRRVLRNKANRGEIACHGRGPGARWRKKG